MLAGRVKRNKLRLRSGCRRAATPVAVSASTNSGVPRVKKDNNTFCSEVKEGEPNLQAGDSRDQHQ